MLSNQRYGALDLRRVKARTTSNTFVEKLVHPFERFPFQPPYNIDESYGRARRSLGVEEVQCGGNHSLESR
ncbi:hypothetical protein, partial [Cupriavidus sp. CuC1]|uniref:hypothetical protein n=1 Tax=Cupriavidus sp. CuC1 TaxID=3373131 RepID=UPI0037D05ED6